MHNAGQIENNGGGRGKGLWIQSPRDAERSFVIRARRAFLSLLSFLFRRILFSTFDKRPPTLPGTGWLRFLRILWLNKMFPRSFSPLQWAPAYTELLFLLSLLYFKDRERVDYSFSSLYTFPRYESSCFQGAN